LVDVTELVQEEFGIEHSCRRNEHRSQSVMAAAVLVPSVQPPTRTGSPPRRYFA
jgi:hypothetical protein